MSAAFAERERERRDLDVEIITGGTEPADHVHDEVVATMADAGFDLSDRTPREIPLDELRACDYVATMGCSTLDVDEVRDDVDVRDWALTDPDGKDPAAVRVIRDEIAERVRVLFDEVARATETRSHGERSE